ncbi:MAG: hypothetical protein RMI91_03995 [Gemmatales bacterium]|nr:hypothetical protein [Gemmatales bacterium]MDW7993795.1 hypothetical protein [Gemmatales bacterium]
MLAAKLRILGAVLVALVVFALIADLPRRWGSLAISEDDPLARMREFREAVLQENRMAFLALLDAPLRERGDALLYGVRRRLLQAVSWVIVEQQVESDTARFVVHEQGRDGWIYPVRYDWVRRGRAWHLVQVTELPPERAVIAPGTRIGEEADLSRGRENESTRTAGGSGRVEDQDADEEEVP